VAARAPPEAAVPQVRVLQEEQQAEAGELWRRVEEGGVLVARNLLADARLSQQQQSGRQRVHWQQACAVAQYLLEDVHTLRHNGRFVTKRLRDRCDFFRVGVVLEHGHRDV